ncbi:hypothetical protein [Draconibacterium sediminis]|uniref:Uncharacterized protein n=1 Tax=Draconibacterium sediminis TaxID=1544798 RepID=A0A0D8J4G7_9BACT|nr:hypothetical protein [Draconibacterium sediminis]KJF41787.1 hypothetical protein LH29_22855 [Draconibacterium sediminis]
MNFEALSKKYKELKSPTKNTDGFLGNEEQNTSFLNILQTQEADAKRKYKRMYILYAIGAVGYLGIFIINTDPDLTIRNRIAGTCFIIAFVILSVLSRKRFSEIKRSSFLDSQKQFLQNARKSYLFWNKQQIWLVPVLLFVNAGATFSVSNHFGNLNILTGVFLFQAAFWCLLGIGFYMGKREWTKKKEAILKKIEAMLLEFEQ